MNKLYYHSIETSEFQIDQKFISSVPSTLQITAPKFFNVPQNPTVLIFLLCLSERFTSCTFPHQNKMNIEKPFKSPKHKNNLSFPIYFSLHPPSQVLVETMV